MMNTSRLPSWIFTFAENTETGDEDQLVVPEDLSGIGDPELDTLEVDLLTAFDAIRAGTLDKQAMDELRTITAASERVKAEQERRKLEHAEMAEEVAAMAARVRPEGEESDPEPEPEPEPEPDPEVETAATEPAAAAVAPPVQTQAAGLAPVRGSIVVPRRQRLNVPMSEVTKRAPDPAMDPVAAAMVIAAPDVPNHVAGRPMDNLDVLVDAVYRRAKTLANPSGAVTVASIRQDYDIVLDRETAPDAIWDIMKKAADPTHLVAAGGWCAPSTIIYDFFNIACDDGILDVPTVGVTRGGIRFPVSPSISDVFSNIWLWTEGDDIAAVTGSGTKPCVRVPCPSFAEERLDCHGLCITAGNLTESAYPELIRNYLSLVMMGHRHVINQRIIADIVANSTAVTITGTDIPVAAGLLGAVGLQVADYREKFRMCDNDVLEVVLPRWAKEAIRSDLAKRNGVDLLAVTDQMINDWFDLRQVRVQFVTDWQVGSGDLPGQSTPRTFWPENVSFLIYAAGTFVVGTGLDLDLGVVRDSTLNAKNDHTAAWTEECKLIAKIGHDSRVVTINFCADGRTGSANLTCATAGA